MAGCLRCCFAVGAVVAFALAVALYPLSQWDANVKLKTRIDAFLLDQLLPYPWVNIPSLVGWLNGASNIVGSRMILTHAGSRAVLEGINIENHAIAGVPVRLYRPSDVDRDEVLPVYIYYHGGGFVTGSLGTYDQYCTSFSVASRMAVVAVDYRLAPEHIFPAAFDDCFAVTKAIVGDGAIATQLAINSSLVSTGGDSAGGGLTAAVALHMSRTDLPPLRSQVVIYPCARGPFFNHTWLSAYRIPNGLPPKAMFHFMSLYIGGLDNTETRTDQIEHQSPDLLPAETWKNATLRVEGDVDVELEMPPADKYPYAKSLLSDALSALLAGDLEHVPPTIVVLAGMDVLHDDGLLYVRRLRASGVEVELHDYPSMVHGFTGLLPGKIRSLTGGVEDFPLAVPEALDSLLKSVDFVRRHI